jgi:hypothetical protein
MSKSNTKFVTFANLILAAIPLIGLFAVGYSTPGGLA